MGKVGDQLAQDMGEALAAAMVSYKIRPQVFAIVPQFLGTHDSGRASNVLPPSAMMT